MVGEIPENSRLFKDYVKNEIFCGWSRDWSIDGVKKAVIDWSIDWLEYWLKPFLVEAVIEAVFGQKRKKHVIGV